VIEKNLGLLEGDAKKLKKILFWHPVQYDMMDNLSFVARLEILWEKLQIIRCLFDKNSSVCKEMNMFILKNYYCQDIELHRFLMILIIKGSIAYSIDFLMENMYNMDMTEAHVFEKLCIVTVPAMQSDVLENMAHHFLLLYPERKEEVEQDEFHLEGDDSHGEVVWMKKFEALLFGEA